MLVPVPSLAWIRLTIECFSSQVIDAVIVRTHKARRELRVILFVNSRGTFSAP